MVREKGCSCKLCSDKGEKCRFCGCKTGMHVLAAELHGDEAKIKFSCHGCGKCRGQ